MIPTASDYFRWGTQSRRLYDRLSCGPATAGEIVRDLHIYGYNRIVSTIRRRLCGTGVTVKARPVNGRRNHWEYRLATVSSESPKFYSCRPAATFREDAGANPD